MNLKKSIWLLGAVLVLAPAGPASSEDDVFLREAKFLLEGYTDYVPDFSVTEVTSAPPQSQFAGSPTLLVRCMPSTPTTTEGEDQPYAWVGRQFPIWGRVDGGTAPYTYEWDFGDGNTMNGATAIPEYIAVLHTYANANLAGYDATLTVTDSNNEQASCSVRIVVEPAFLDEKKVRTNAAIQDGLRWLYLNQESNGSFGDNNAATGAAIAAFELQGHLPSNDPLTDIYAEFVLAGLEFIFSELERGTWGQPNADTNGNGGGLYSGFTGIPAPSSAYVQGLIMLPIALTGTPDAITASLPVDIGLPPTYKNILTDLADQLAYSQTGSPACQRGGWRYDITGPNSDSDMSAVQWAAIGLAAAQDPCNEFGVEVPQFVKDELDIFLGNAQAADGGFFYQCSGSRNLARTGAGLFAELWLRDFPAGGDITDPEFLDAERARDWLDANWCGDQYNGNFYALYSTKKSLDDFQLTLPSHDWRDDNRTHLVKGLDSNCGSNGYKQKTDTDNPGGPGDLASDGNWDYDTFWVDWAGRTATTSFALLALIPGTTCLPVVCDFFASPPATCPNEPVELDGSASYSEAPGAFIVQWDWDFDASDGVIFDPPDAKGASVWNLEGYPVEGTYTVTLRVTDNLGSVGVCSQQIEIDELLSCPVADLPGPFTACVGEEICLDGCSSFDPECGLPDSIVEYRWDLDSDGTVDAVTTTCEGPCLTFFEERVQTVTLTVVDSFGCESAADADLIWSSYQDVAVTPDDLVLDPQLPDCDALEIWATVHATVEGGAPPIAEVGVAIFYDEVNLGKLICKETLLNLQNGDSETIHCTWAVPDTLDHEIIVVADWDEAIMECTETDNQASKIFDYEECLCVEVVAGDPSFTGGVWLLPIETPDPLDEPIFGYSIDYLVDPSIFEVKGYETAGTMIEFAADFIEFNEISPGHYRVAWAAVNPLVGPGVFVYLVANLTETAPCGDCVPLEIGDVLLNEGVPCATPMPGEFCVPTTPISGTVTYYACDALDNDPANPRPIADVQMHVAIDCGASQDADSTWTDENGEYVLGACDDCDNCLTPSKTKDLENPFVSPFDASIVLKTVAETYTPDFCPLDPAVYDQTGNGDFTFCPPPEGFDAGVEVTGPNPDDFVIYPQRVAGDVSKNGALTALDAALILQYAVGDSMGLASNAGTWEFYCADRCYSPVASIVDADFVGILGGDVSGDWDPAGIPIPTTGAAAIVVQVTSESTGDQWRFNVSLSGAEGFLAAKFEVGYDARQWEYLGINTTAATAEFLTADHAQNGSLKVAMAGAEAAPDGEVIHLLFKRKGGPGSQEPRVLGALINDGSRPVQILSSPSTGVEIFSEASFGADGFAVAPNPFDGTVNLAFRLDRPGHVSLRIFAVDGRLVRTLLAEDVSSSALSVQWDGTDESGRRVATGNYFARLRRGNETAVRRLVMIR
jgi:PKD repeat protein